MTFQTPFGALRLTTLPMGWTNSVPIFHEDVTKILQAEIPHITQPYIDDVPVCGPATQYVLPLGEEERIPQNAGIRRFIWEHFQDLNCVVQRMKHAGGTFSGIKTHLGAAEQDLLGHCLTIEGQMPEGNRISKVLNWGPCKDLSDVCTFLGTIGICRMFIKNFTHRAHHLVRLTHKGTEWEFGRAQLEAMDNLKDTLKNSTALCPLNYTSAAPIILSVNTSSITISYLPSPSTSERCNSPNQSWNYTDYTEYFVCWRFY